MVELLLTLLVLYGLQCAVLLPRGATLWLVCSGTRVRSEGPGWRLLHPWPSAWSWLAARPNILRDGAALRTLGPTPWLGAGFAEGEGPRLEPGGGQPVQVRGTRILVDGEPALRGLDKGHAARLGAVCRALAADGADVDAILEGALERSFDAETLRGRRQRAAEATRWLAGVSDACLAALFVVLPGLASWLGGERALLFFGPAYLALHLAGTLLLVRAHATLDPESGGQRFEAVLAAALYPPLLLRAAQELRRQALSGFHPAVVAVEVLPADAALDFLRGELARQLPERERAEVERLIERLGSTPEALLAAPERADPLAKSYCATCRTEYRLEAGTCSDCGTALDPFPSAS